MEESGSKRGLRKERIEDERRRDLGLGGNERIRSLPA